MSQGPYIADFDRNAEILFDTHAFRRRGRKCDGGGDVLREIQIKRWGIAEEES